MIAVRETEVFRAWLIALRDRTARLRINARIERLALGHLGDAKPVGDGVSELRFHFGPGYRLYLTRRGTAVTILLAGGDKDSGVRDIATAKSLAADLED